IDLRQVGRHQSCSWIRVRWNLLRVVRALVFASQRDRAEGAGARIGSRKGDAYSELMMRKVAFLLGVWIAPLFIAWNLARAISPDVQPAPLVRLTGVLEAVENPPPSSFPDLRVWFGDKSRMFHVVKAEPVMPAYRIREQLRKAPSLGLRLAAEGDAL